MGIPEHGTEGAKAKDRPASSLVKYYMHRIEDGVLRPTIMNYQAFFDKRPVLATFTAIFTCLNILPVVSFLGVSLFTVFILVSMALSCAFIAASGIILGFFCILAFILAATFCTSILLTLASISAYLFFRLVVLTKQDGRSGVYHWAEETKLRIIPLPKTTLPGNDFHEASVESVTKPTDSWEEEKAPAYQGRQNLGEYNVKQDK